MSDPSKKYVVYLLPGDNYRVHGGPYTPMKAREVRRSMEKHIENGNHRDWNIPEETEEVKALTREELTELKLRSISREEPPEDANASMWIEYPRGIVVNVGSGDADVYSPAGAREKATAMEEGLRASESLDPEALAFINDLRELADQYEQMEAQ